MLSPVAWGVLGGIAAVLTVIGSIAVWLYRHNSWRLVKLGKDPITVVFTPAAGSDEPTWALSSPDALAAGDLTRAPGPVNGVPVPSKVRTWLIRNHGAYDVGSTEVSMVWANRSTEPILVRQVRASVLARSGQQHATLFKNPGGGEPPIVKLGFDLDLPTPLALSLVPNAEDPDSADAAPYFANRTLTLAPGEQVAVDVTASISAGDCEWVIDVDTVVGKAQSTQRIRPSKVTAFRTAAVAPATTYDYVWITGLALLGVKGHLNFPLCGQVVSLVADS